MLALLVPRLLDVDAGTLAACAPLQRVAARAQAQVVADAEAAFLRAQGCDAAVAPLAALGAGLDVGRDWIARADPVTTHVSHDDVRIVSRVDDLDDAETLTLRTMLDRHFADDGLAFVAPRRDAWFVRSAEAHAVTLVPLAAAIGRPLRALLPSGADAKRWRRWWTEVQMLLHEQPLALREHAPVHALWFAGGGRLPAALPASIAAFATATREGDVVRGLARLSGCAARSSTALHGALDRSPAGTAIAACVDPIGDGTALAAFADDVLVPALRALDGGRVDRLLLVGTGRGAAACWEVRPPGWVDRLLRRRSPFVVPAPEDE